MRSITTIFVIYCLFNFQISSDVIQMKPEIYKKIINSINHYNKNIYKPSYLPSMLESMADKKYTTNLIKKYKIQKLLKIKQNGKNSWQIKTKNAVISFNIASMSEGMIYINHKEFKLTKYSSAEKMAKMATIIINNHPLKKTGFFKFLKELLLKDASADGGLTAGLVIAGVVALFAITVSISKRRSSQSKKNSKGKVKKTSDSDSGNSKNDSDSDQGNSGEPFSVTSVGPSLDHGFFSLKTYKDKLYAGSFGYGKKQMIYSYDGGSLAPVSPGFTVSESVCALQEFGGYLYANTEAKGKIFRSQDGNNWQQVYKAPQPIGCGLAVFGGHIYATNTNYPGKTPGLIYRSSNGTDWKQVYNSNNREEYLKEIMAFKDKIYAFHVKGAVVSSDGINWQAMNTPARMFKSHVAGNQAIITSGKKYSNTNESAIWSFDGNNFTKLFGIGAMSHVSGVYKQGNNILAITTVQFKGKQGGATLVASCDGGKTFKSIHTFKETEGWGVEEYKGNLFVGTKQDGGGGQVYKVTGYCNAKGTNTGNADSNGTGNETDDNGSGAMSIDYHHYNPQAWHGVGVAIVLCPGSVATSCSILRSSGERPMGEHGSYDEGRQVWSIRGETGYGGKITCNFPSGPKTFSVNGGNDMTWGTCN